MLKLLRFSPGTALAAVVALAMGIGFTTTMFSIVHGATRPLPVKDPDEIVAVSKTIPGSPADASTRPVDYRAWSEAARSFEALAAFENVSVNLSEDTQEPERLSGTAVTANAFGLLGATPALGRAVEPDDTSAGAERIVVLSHALWQRRFAGDPSVLGRTVRLTGVRHTVVGVMPRRFGFPVNAAFWVPLEIEADTAQPGTGPRLQVFGRLADGKSRASAQADIETIVRATERATDLRDVRIEVVPFAEIETPREVIRGLYLLVVAVSFVLLIACSNVANLLLARAAARSRDVAVRVALGATRRQIVMEQLAESLSLSIVASFAGLGLAHAGTRVFAASTSHIIEAYWVDFRVDGMVVLFASLLAGCAAVAAGLGPALKAASADAIEALKDRGGSSLRVGRVSRALIAVQITLACGLLALTMILGRSAVELRAAPWPFDAGRILSAELGLTETLVSDVAARARFIRQLTDELQRIPGLDAAGLTTALPGRGAGSWSFALDRPAEARARTSTGVAFVTPEFFDVVDGRVLAGRALSWNDDAAAPAVAVVNESFARRFSADRDPIGRQIFLGERALTIVGIVPDLMARDVQDTRQDSIYASILQFRPFAVRIVARGRQDALTLVPSLREAVRRVDRDLPLQEMFTLHEAVYRDKRVLDVLSSLFLLFGVGALSLTAVGLYAVVSFGVTQRTREIGVRMALGATRAQIMTLVVGQGSRQLAIGLVAGLALAVALSRGFAAAIDAIAPADAPLLAAIAASLAFTTLIALVMPVRRAMNLQIVRALRVE